ncbi:MAG: SH3 domain-containing protein [Alphaproteobacteria bacterium]|nr:SH3 domain-containing protein [Alphaproteobacteria bacterium]MCL2505449.1 SH3 domain-containing protein [Alphaproteobacteria bacterium]
MSDVAFAGGVRAPGKEIPRFVSLREEQTSVRTGPGGRYPTDWVYKKQALPVEVVAEHDVWLRIRDPHGDMGWVRRTAVSSKRTIFVSADSAKIYKGMSVSSGVIANVEAGAIGQVVSCEMSWCKIKFPEAKGFMRKPEIWGVYDDEFI